MSSTTVVNDSINEVMLKEKLCEIDYTIVEKLNNTKGQRKNHKDNYKEKKHKTKKIF